MVLALLHLLLLKCTQQPLCSSTSPCPAGQWCTRLPCPHSANCHLCRWPSAWRPPPSALATPSGGQSQRACSPCLPTHVAASLPAAPTQSWPGPMLCQVQLLRRHAGCFAHSCPPKPLTMHPFPQGARRPGYQRGGGSGPGSGAACCGALRPDPLRPHPRVLRPLPRHLHPAGTPASLVSIF